MFFSFTIEYPNKCIETVVRYLLIEEQQLRTTLKKKCIEFNNLVNTPKISVTLDL